ncbi:Gluconokinase [Comamonas sp. PE63]|uniref:Gluconokinase n=1 Tax=Comamonas brasiliensis TaxID=1812482 RepID=A0ABS5LX23_9BURK|nr:gluconokinase [Comamonas sp. PE63]MBS3021063.1 Gluconokinase [Comamonas sp. PE63]
MIQSKIQPPGTMSALVVMGVSGCGKSSAGEAIAQQLGWTLVEGDSYHSPQSVAKMQAGIALTDADREGWLERLARRLAQADAEHGLVLTCSALKRKYRDQLRSAQQLGFVFLDLDYATALERVQTRPGHFFSPDLVANQFTTLEDPRQEPDVLTVSATMNLNDIALAARQWARRESQA